MSSHELMLVYIAGMRLTQAIAAVLLAAMLLGLIAPWEKKE